MMLAQPTSAYRPGADLLLHFLGQFVHFFALMLRAGSTAGAACCMPQLATAIVLVVIVNGLFAFLQEHPGPTFGGLSCGTGRL